MVLSSAARDLRTALDDFRRERMITKFGEAMLDAYGASVIMPDAALDRLVECANTQKIASIEDIRREVGKQWSKVHKHGDTVLSLVKRHFPPEVPFVSTPLASRAQVLNTSGSTVTPSSPTRARAGPDAAATPARPAVKRYKCSACHAVGHNSEYLTFVVCFR
ncbi:hypothetical protein FOMPIDRAFT_1118437 [Fomitopsis schrenkii]|uniref:Uncharacterized protein n=1 Tax=Fomitopsis schrenkii TaxID=2126942 RepID=S8EGP2_FOMSC|nr:hypothetical protein FOMPIDRAFT_1118437 [Fomitopsis schrenkii]